MPLRQHTHDPLGDLELFAGCTPSEILRARQFLTMLTVDPGTVLIREGGYGTEFLIIAAGEAAVSMRTPFGDRQVATLGRGDFVGEMSLLEHNRRSATVTATTALTVYVANAAEFTALLEAVPAVAQRIMQTAAERQETNRRSLAA